jgi:ligand-binding sensor domain-containing protein
MRVLLLTAMLCYAAAGFAQPAPEHRVSFRLIGKKDGFPYTSSHCFLQGSDGVLWIGTGATLVRYDGQEFMPITLGPERASIQAACLLEGRDSTIWAATSKGVVRIDPLHLTAERFLLHHERAVGTDGLPLTSMAWSHRGQLLCGTMNGLFHFETSTGSFSELATAAGEPVRAARSIIQADSALHGLWIETWNKGLIFYDTLAGKLYERDGDKSVSPWIGEDLVCLTPDGQGGYWASAHLQGELWQLRTADGSTRRWGHVPGNPRLNPTGLMFMARDRSGTIWGSDWNMGAFRFDPADSSASGFKWLNDEYGTLPHGYLTAMLQLSSGEIWFGNPAGIITHDPSQPQVRVIDFAIGASWTGALPISSDVFAEGDSVLWCMTYTAGLFRHDLRSGNSRRIALPDEAGREAYVNDVRSVDGTVYLATTKGLLRYEHRSMQAVPVTMRLADGNSAPRKNISWVEPDGNTALWMKSWKALSRFDTRTGIVQRWEADSLRSNGLPMDNFHAGDCSPDGRLWICSEQTGIVYFDPAQQSWISLYDDLKEGRSPARRILDIALGPDGMLWLATDGNGLVRYDRRSRTYTQFDQRHGFSGVVIQTIAFDRLGRLWLGTFEGLHCFDPRTGRAVPVDVSSGMLFDEFSLGSSMASNGLFYIADRKRIIEFDPNTVTFGSPPPAPIITRVLIDGAAVRPAHGAVDMPYGKQQLEIRFGAILPPGHISMYATRLNEGAWSESSEGKLSLRGLQPGTHAFELKVMNREGLWSPVIHLRVIMTPPWWQTLAARIVLAVLLASAIVLAFRLRLNWIRRRERRAEATARTVNELKLQALRAQMDPHFIFNCLNSIDKYILMEQGEQASRYLNRFAKLVRLILNQSDSVSVPLEKEAEMLRYYLELEALRFKSPFTWEVKVDPELALAEAELPTMLVQPYVENAIWHGLQHKESAGRIIVEFRKLGNDLECTIEDDGIGREASARINADRRVGHLSKGMRVNADRLRLFEETHGSGVRSEIIDLKDRDGNALGTRVRLVLPIESLEEEPLSA